MTERIVRFESGHDCLRFECKFGSEKCRPNAGGSHGLHGVTIRFVLKGEAGAVQFMLYTGWLPQHVLPSQIACRDVDNWGDNHVLPADLGYHSKTPRYDGQETSKESCEFCDGQPCYYDGSSLNASDAMYALVNGGDEALWKFLEEYYTTVFQDGPYPQPPEYSKPLRDALKEGEDDG